MKNLTRILAMVLVFSLMISSAAFAASFTDVEDGSAVAEATHVLSDLGILYGYEDGSFGPDKTITRAELVAVANRLQGLSDAAKAAGGVTAYTDVPADEWYAGDVNLATQMGVISGDGNGLFRPNDPVKYEEAVKMIVASLGYTQKYVDEKGGWPTGYLVIASEADVTKGLSNTAGTEAPRGIVARLAFNALTSPRMVLSSYASDGTAVYAPNTANILLDDKLGTYRLEGYVRSNGISSLYNTKPEVDVDEVSFYIDAKVGSVQNAFMADKDNFKGNFKLLVGETDAADYLGLNAHAYIQENEDGDWEIVSFVVQTKKNVTAVIENTKAIQKTDATKYASVLGAYTTDTVDGETVTVPAAAQSISVFDEETDSTNTIYDLDDNAIVIVNGQYLAPAYSPVVKGAMHNVNGAATPALGLYYAPEAGKVELLDNNNDGDYDFIFVTSYETVIVDEVYANNTKISTEFSGSIDLDFENKKGHTYSITMDGEEITLADLQKGDVLSIAVTANKNNYEIIGTRKTVEGAIDEMDSDNGIYKVDGTEYEIANVADTTKIGIGSVTPGDEGILYLDAFDKIAYFDRTSATAKNYGFIVGAGDYASVGDVTYEVQMLDKDGTVATYTLADNVRVTDYNDANPAPASMTAADLYNNEIKTMALGSKWVLKTGDDTALNMLRNYAGRLVTYTVNSQSKISAIAFADTTPNDTDNFNFDSVVAGDTDSNRAEYKENLGSLGNIGVTEDTVVFSLPIDANSAKDDFEVTSIDSLGDGGFYNVAYFNVDDEGNAGAIIITNSGTKVGAGSSLAVVTKIMAAKNENAETVYNVTFLQGGEEKTLTTTSELYGLMGSSYNRGDVFEYAVNAEGEISDIVFAGSANGTMATEDTIATLVPSASLPGTTNNNTAYYVFGAVYAKSANRVIQLAKFNGTTLDSTLVRHKISEDANIVVVDLNKSEVSNARVKAGAYGDIQDMYFNNGNLDGDRDVSVLIKYYKDEITDVIVYLGYGANVAHMPLIPRS